MLGCNPKVNVRWPKLSCIEILTRQDGLKTIPTLLVRIPSRSQVERLGIVIVLPFCIAMPYLHEGIGQRCCAVRIVDTAL